MRINFDRERLQRSAYKEKQEGFNVLDGRWGNGKKTQQESQWTLKQILIENMGIQMDASKEHQ